MKHGVFVLAALIAVGIAVGAIRVLPYGLNPVQESDAGEPLRTLTQLPVHDLVLQEATFDIITKARLDDGGSPVLYFMSAGAFGTGDAKLVLFRGCVRVRYGLNMVHVTPEECDVTDGILTIRLPAPQVIGNPVILTDDTCESRILDVQGEGWWAGYVQRAEVQTRIHQEYAKNAAHLCDGLGMEQKTKERAEQVLRAFLLPVLKARGLTLVVQWSLVDDEAEETKPGQGVTEGVSDVDAVERPNTETGDSFLPDCLDVLSGLPGDEGGIWCVGAPAACGFDTGLAGDAQFDFAREPVRGVPAGGVRPAGPGWIPAE